MNGASVRLTVGVEIAVTGLSRAAEAEIIPACTFANPAFARKERLGLWTGATDAYIASWRRTPAGLIVPRGADTVVTHVCQDHGLGYTVTDETACPAIGLDLRLRGRLHPFQEEAVAALLRHRNGFLQAPTGSGKTIMALATAARLRTTILILTHTRPLLEQTAQRCHDLLGVEPGIIGAGKWTMAPIVVGMVQTLARRDLADLRDTFGAILVDEAHHSPCRTWAAVIAQFRARYLYGFTATPFRKDGLEQLMWLTVGPIVSKTSQAVVVQTGTILEPEVETIPTDFFFDLVDTLDWGRMLTALAEDEARNTLIADEVRRRLTPDTRALVLVDRIEHAYRLAAHLADVDPIVLVGTLSKADRDTAMAAARAGTAITIATSSLLGEGVDLPALDLLALASPMSGGARTLQAVGRICRAAPGKHRALVVDFLDHRVSALAAAHRQRERVLGAAA